MCPWSFLDQLGKEERPVFQDGPCAFLGGSARQSGGGRGSEGASTTLRSADLPTADTVTGPQPVTQFFSPSSRFSKRSCFRETWFQKRSSWGLGGRQAPSTFSCR